MNLSKSFGKAFADGVLAAFGVTVPEGQQNHRLDGPARFWADPPPGH